MPKSFRHYEEGEIDIFLSSNDNISQELKMRVLTELQSKAKKFKDSHIWLTPRQNYLSLDVYDNRGDVFDTTTFYYNDSLPL